MAVRVLIGFLAASQDIVEVSAGSLTLHEEDESLIQFRSSSSGSLNPADVCPDSVPRNGNRADSDPWVGPIIPVCHGKGNVATGQMDACQDLVHKHFDRQPDWQNDLPPWGNGHYGNPGLSCAVYEENFCKNGFVIRGEEWAMGHKYNYPETGCCACGKGKSDGDTPNWGNGHYGNPGFSCLVYEAHWCEVKGGRGRFRSGMEWTGGAKYKYPELNCVACGKFRYGYGSPVSAYRPYYGVGTYLEQLAPANDTEFVEFVKNPDGKDASKDVEDAGATDEMDEFAMNAGGEIEATVVAWKLANMEADKVSR